MVNAAPAKASEAGCFLVSIPINDPCRIRPAYTGLALPSRRLSACVDFFLTALEAFAAVVIKLGAGLQNKGFLARIKGAFGLVVANVVERIPVLAFFNAFQIVIGIDGLLKEAFFVEIIPVLTLPQCDGLAQRSGLASFADYGKIALAVYLTFFEVHLLGHSDAGESNKNNKQEKQQTQIHNHILNSRGGKIVVHILKSTCPP